MPEQSALNPQRRQRMQPLIFASCRVSPQFSQKSTGVTAGVGALGGGRGGSGTAHMMHRDAAPRLPAANEQQRLIVQLGAVRARGGDDAVRDFT